MAVCRNGIGVDFLDGLVEGLAEVRADQQRAFGLLDKMLQPFVGAEAGTRWPAKLAANGFLFGGDELHALGNQVVVILQAGQCRGVRQCIRPS